MKVFLSLCLLFCLLSPAMLLFCQKCFDRIETTCEYSDTQKCLPHESCRRTTVTGDLLPIVIARASYRCSRCQEENFAFTTGESGNFSMTTECCRSDRCNGKLPQNPSQPMEPNGLECLGCYAEGQEECTGVERVRCPGDQTKCIKMSMKFVNLGFGDNRIFSARGCATPSMCDEERMKLVFSSSDYMAYGSSVKCSNAL